ncbi:MAG: hypothetical protein K9M82_13150 [Deltaproteobacteria bacterium]|nr:hypothetical protein [Deltaproteobacteria bacterium]
MEQKGKSRAGLWILVLVILAAAGLISYFAFSRPAEEPAPGTAPGPAPLTDEQPSPEVPRQPVPPGPETAAPSSPEEPPALEGDGEGLPGTAGGGEGLEVENSVDECVRIERDVRDFFGYLDEQAYVRRLTRDADAWTVFVRALGKLAARPPLPAGEGLDPAVMTGNIYHLFRVLDDREIHLARDVIQHEGDTLELNLDILYQWLTLGERCPDPEGIRPSREVLYRYAGFFMNTIGGRSYLFRRATWLRLLISYYAVLILHDADRDGINSFGLDVLPMARKVRDEVARFGGYHFQETYLERLDAVAGYYQGRRGLEG